MSISDLLSIKNLRQKNMTLNSWLDQWFEHYLYGIKSNTIASYRSYSNHHIRDYLGEVKMTRLKKSNVQEWVSQLAHSGKLTPKTIKNVHGVLHAALSEAVNNDILEKNPADGVRLPKIIKKEMLFLEKEEINIFLELIEPLAEKNLFTISLFTGMRLGEMLGLEWSDIDFKNRKIKISKQLQYIREGKYRHQYRIVPLKNNKPRVISFPSIVYDALTDERKRQSYNKELFGKAWISEPGLEDLVFTNERGRHLNHSSISRKFQVVIKKSSLNKQLRFHDLRHTYASISLTNGDDPKTLQKHLGHHSPSFTLAVYGHVSEEMENESINNMERYIQSL